jgi:hypothetical protein
MDLKTIKVTWMDGREETYGQVTASVINGVLHVYQYTGITSTLTNEWHHPISNIRTWATVRGLA